MSNCKIIRSVTSSKSLIFCRGIMQKMRGEGYEMVAVSSPGKELESLREEGFHCVELAMERHISPFKDLRSLVSMIRVLHKERPQMIHSMTPKAGLVSMLAGWLTGVPIRVHTFTGLVWPTSTGFKRKLLMFTDRLTCACATHIIPEGKGVMNDLINGHITSKPMRVLGYGNVRGVDMARFNPHRFIKDDHSIFRFLFIGRIVGDKGINELVDAFIRLNQEFPDTELSLVGTFESELDSLSPGTMTSIKENKSIFVREWIVGEELVKEYAAADCYVHPSYREGFPNTVLEAGAMGLPCIVTDINGSNEIIEDGKNGIIIPAKDADALYEAMKRIFVDKERRLRLATFARNIVAERFDKEFVQKCQMDFYKELL